MEKSFLALGLMSGTSMDGIDAAIIRTDGRRVFEHGPTYHLSYEPEMRTVLRKAVALGPDLANAPWPTRIHHAEQAITAAHIDAVRGLLEVGGFRSHDIDFIGFHGQTIFHDASRKITIQIGDAQHLADEIDIDVIADFRSADLAAGGQGAPFAPLYHRAMIRESGITDPAAVVNIGGVGNVTFCAGDDLIAFDTGPGNALIDDWISARTGKPFDEFGAIASVGKVNAQALDTLLAHEFFAKVPPKSLDRGDFTSEPVHGLSIEDGAATLAAFTAATIAGSIAHLPEEPKGWIICGGGRHNVSIMRELEMRLPGSVQTAEEAGWRGDDLEAEAVGFLAVRSFLGLPLSLPGTTGVPAPQAGGRLFSSAA